MSMFQYRAHGLTAVTVSALVALAPAASAADVVQTGQVGTGVDQLGGTYFAGGTGGGLLQFNEITGLQSTNTASAVPLNIAGTGLANVTSFTLTITGSNETILPLDRGFGDYFLAYTAGSSVPSSWSATVNDAGTAITYSADSAADALVSGDGFNTITTFTPGGDNLPADFSYTITWSGDAVAAAVPEAATWAMMVIGFGAIGGSVRRKRALTVRAA